MSSDLTWSGAPKHTALSLATSAGSVAFGAGIGLAFAGPVGAVGGAVAGWFAETVGKEMVTWLTSREADRVTNVHRLVHLCVEKRLSQGGILRSEFASPNPSAARLTEEILQAARRSTNEKKAALLAHFLVNVMFDSTCSLLVASAMLASGEAMPYSQFVMLSLIGSDNAMRRSLDAEGQQAPALDEAKFSEDERLLLQDCFDLMQAGWVEHGLEDGTVTYLSSSSIWPGDLRLSQRGKRYSQLYSLEKVSDEDRLSYETHLRAQPSQVG